MTNFSAIGLETGESLYFFGNAWLDRINHVGLWVSPFDASGLFIGNAYQSADPELTPVDIIDVLAGDVAEQGGQFGHTLLQKGWRH